MFKPDSYEQWKWGTRLKLDGWLAQAEVFFFNGKKDAKMAQLFLKCFKKLMRLQSFFMGINKLD